MTKTTSDIQAEKLGKYFTEGVISTLGKWFLIGLVLVLAIRFIADRMGAGFDGTDDRANRSHSGLKLRTDYGTGCQYLETSGGGLTPRLDGTGKQFCN
jgi:hypothetical protein